MNFPDNLKYTAEHEWIRIEGQYGWIGITDYAQSELGDVVFVEIPTVGTKVEKGKSFGTIEAVKAVSDLFAPVDGEYSHNRSCPSERSPQCPIVQITHR